MFFVEHLIVVKEFLTSGTGLIQVEEVIVYAGRLASFVPDSGPLLGLELAGLSRLNLLLVAP